MCEAFLNSNSLFDYKLLGRSAESLSAKDISVLPPSLAGTEVSRERWISIPPHLASAYRTFRPTPVFRAGAFEEAIKTDCRIYIKDEGATPSGNHKMNSALFIAYMCKRDGVHTLTTETTGNWGVALAMAAGELGIRTVCFLDCLSHAKRPEMKDLMELAGASVVVVANDQGGRDSLTLSADAAIRYTKDLPGAAYVFGSVYGYFLVPQSLVGLEARRQLQEISLYPDIVVGSCGGGANLIGIAAPFLVDLFEGARPVEIWSTEATSCPILTQGRLGLHGIDTDGYFPFLHTYGLERVINDGNYIGGLGTTIVASAVSHFHSRGAIKAHVVTGEEARQAADVFYRSEGRRVALETAYILAGVIYIAALRSRKIILASISASPAGVVT